MLAVVLSMDAGVVSLNDDDQNTSSASLEVDGVDNLYECGFYFVRNGTLNKFEGGTLIGTDAVSEK